MQAHPFSLASDEDEKHLPALKLSLNEERFPCVAAFLQTSALFSAAWASAQFEAGLSLFLDGLPNNPFSIIQLALDELTAGRPEKVSEWGPQHSFASR